MHFFIAAAQNFVPHLPTHIFRFVITQIQEFPFPAELNVIIGYFTFFCFFLSERKHRLVPNQAKNCKYNTITSDILNYSYPRMSIFNFDIHRCVGPKFTHIFLFYFSKIKCQIFLNSEYFSYFIYTQFIFQITYLLIICICIFFPF